MKEKTVYICRECGYVSHTKLGRCPDCESWSSFDVKTQLPELTQDKKRGLSGIGEIKPLSGITPDDSIRCKTGMNELDRVLGGGVVKGSLILIGGDPGIGKSTLLLQISQSLTANHKKVLYVSGEESLSQIKLRATRLHVSSDSVYVMSETDLDTVLNTASSGYDFVIIDSIQTMYKRDIQSVPGSISQVREATTALMSLAKEKGVSVFVVGHVTKDGAIAGPKVLEHMVDTVLYFEGDGDYAYRILRSVKNRFGSTNEIAMFEMRDKGLVEITNPSELFVQKREVPVPGTVVTCSVNGSRALLAEVQSLVVTSSYNYPKSSVSGLDFNRISMITAVLQKRLGVDLSNKDIYVSLTGGLKITEPACDLAVLLAIYSNYKAIPMPKNTVAFGEVGLSGEVRSVTYTEKRISEAARIGYNNIIVANGSVDKNLAENLGVNIVEVSNIRQALEFVAQ